jgi:hypothetical protein
VLVLQAAQLRDQDQVAIALAAVALAALKARCDRSPLVFEGEEGSPVRTDPWVSSASAVARRARRYLRGLDTLKGGPKPAGVQRGRLHGTAGFLRPVHIGLLRPVPIHAGSKAPGARLLPSHQPLAE